MMTDTESHSSSRAIDEITSTIVVKELPHVNDEFESRLANLAQAAVSRDQATILPGNLNASMAITPSRVARFRMQRGDFSASSIVFRSMQKQINSWSMYLQNTLDTPGIKNILEQAGIYHAVKSSDNSFVIRDKCALVAFMSRWCSGTNSFILAWGELVITLEDVAALLRLPIYGELRVSLNVDERDVHTQLIIIVETLNKHGDAYASWMMHWTKASNIGASVLSIAAFLLLWLSKDVFEDIYEYKKLKAELILYAIKLAQGTPVPIGSLFLGTLYTHLSTLLANMTLSNGAAKVETFVSTNFVQAWLYEHYPGYAPKGSAKDKHLSDQARIVRWMNKPISKDFLAFMDDEAAVVFRPWTSIPAGIAQLRSFGSNIIPAKILSVDDDLTDEEQVFMISSCSGHVLGISDSGAYVVRAYNVDRGARQMGFDQDVPSQRGPPPQNMKAYRTRLLSPVSFLSGERVPSVTQAGRRFWDDQVQLYRDFVASPKEVRAIPSKEDLEAFSLLKYITLKRKIGDMNDLQRSSPNSKLASPATQMSLSLGSHLSGELSLLQGKNSSMMNLLNDKQVPNLNKQDWVKDGPATGVEKFSFVPSERSPVFEESTPNTPSKSIDMITEQNKDGGSTDPKSFVTQPSGDKEAMNNTYFAGERLSAGHNLNEDFDNVADENPPSTEIVIREIQVSEEIDVTGVDAPTQWALREFPHAGLAYDLPHEIILPGHILVEGFNVPEEHVPLYRRIWARYGHLITAGRRDHLNTLAGVVADLMGLISKMYATPLTETTDEELDEAEELFASFKDFKPNLLWLQARIQFIRTRRAVVGKFTQDFVTQEERHYATMTEELRKLTEKTEKKAAAIALLKKAVDEGAKSSLDGCF